MHVGVEKTIAKYLLEGDSSRLCGNVQWVVAGGFDAVAIVQGDAGNPLCGHYSLTSAAPIYVGDLEVRVAFEVFSYFRSGGRLKAEIHLHFHCRRQGCYNLARFKSPQVGPCALDQVGAPMQEI